MSSTTEPWPSLTVLKSRPAHLAHCPKGQMARPHKPLITRALPQCAECANHTHLITVCGRSVFHFIYSLTCRARTEQNSHRARSASSHPQHLYTGSWGSWIIKWDHLKNKTKGLLSTGISDHVNIKRILIPRARTIWLHLHVTNFHSCLSRTCPSSFTPGYFSNKVNHYMVV